MQPQKQEIKVPHSSAVQRDVAKKFWREIGLHIGSFTLISGAFFGFYKRKEFISEV